MRCTICDKLLALNHRSDICTECQTAGREAASPLTSSDEEELSYDIT